MSQQNKHLEIERRWLLSGLPKTEIQTLKRCAIHDSFYLTGNRDPEVRFKRVVPMRLPVYPEDRFRPLKCSYQITVKFGEGVVRTELKISNSCILNEHLFLLYGRKNKYPAIRKQRFKIRLAENIVWEIDEFWGRLDNLFMAEIESESLDKVQAIIIPEWLKPLIIKEVTNDPRYYNKNLAVHGRPNPE